MPGVDAPAASCVIKNTRVSHHRYTGITRHSRTQWFYGLLRDLPGDQACLTPSSALLLADLTPASGVRTTRLGRTLQAALVSRAAASTASLPAFVTFAKRPSVGRDRANQ